MTITVIPPATSPAVTDPDAVAVALVDVLDGLDPVLNGEVYNADAADPDRGTDELWLTSATDPTQRRIKVRIRVEIVGGSGR